MAIETVYRFLTVRPANVSLRFQLAATRIRLYDDTGPRSSFFLGIEHARTSGATRDEIVQLESPRLLRRLDSLSQAATAWPVWS